MSIQNELKCQHVKIYFQTNLSNCSEVINVSVIIDVQPIEH